MIFKKQCSQRTIKRIEVFCQIISDNFKYYQEWLTFSETYTEPDKSLVFEWFWEFKWIIIRQTI